jgi:hypothetical protein
MKKKSKTYENEAITIKKTLIIIIITLILLAIIIKKI